MTAYELRLYFYSDDYIVDTINPSLRETYDKLLGCVEEVRDVMSKSYYNDLLDYETVHELMKAKKEIIAFAHKGIKFIIKEVDLQ